MRGVVAEGGSQLVAPRAHVVSVLQRSEAKQELGRRTPRNRSVVGEPPSQSPTMIASLTCVCLKGGRLADAVDVIVADCAWSSIAIASSGCSLLYRATEAGESHLHIDWIS